jgi:hypothetical protein
VGREEEVRGEEEEPGKESRWLIPCRMEYGEHLAPLGRGDFYIYSHRELSTITIRPLNIYKSNTPVNTTSGRNA